MSKEVEKKKTTEVAVFEKMGEMDTTGFEGADGESFATPFLRILQSNSPQIEEDSDNFIQGGKAGLFFNTVTNELYGKEVNVIPVKFERMFVEWKPNRQGFVGMHSVEEAMAISEPGSVFGSRLHAESGNILQDTHTFYLLIAGYEEEGPLVFPLSSTGIRHSRKWMSMARMLRLPSRKLAPLYSSIYQLTTVVNENDQGRWYQIGDKSKTSIERIGWVNEDQFMFVKQAVTMFDQIKANLAKPGGGFEGETPY